MARSCKICNKGPIFGNRVSHSNRRTRRKWSVNVVSIKAIVNKSVTRIKVCTRCLRSGKVVKAF